MTLFQKATQIRELGKYLETQRLYSIRPNEVETLCTRFEVSEKAWNNIFFRYNWSKVSQRKLNKKSIVKG